MSDTLRWFKSSYSSDSGGNCVEVALDWRTSTYSSSSGGECVEVAACPHTVHVRDSKIEASPELALAPEAWAAFLDFAAGASGN